MNLQQKFWISDYCENGLLYILLNDFSMAFFRINQAIVKDGITSVKGIASSRKFNTPPINPNLPPNSLLKIKAEMGAHIISENSARNGKT
jgi:hypothetical protein